MTRNNSFIATANSLLMLRSRYGTTKCGDCGTFFVPDQLVYARTSGVGRFSTRVQYREHFCEKCWNKKYH